MTSSNNEIKINNSRYPALLSIGIFILLIVYSLISGASSWGKIPNYFMISIATYFALELWKRDQQIAKILKLVSFKADEFGEIISSTEKQTQINLSSLAKLTVDSHLATGAFKVKDMGTPQDAEQELLQAISKADWVKNTFIGLFDREMNQEAGRHPVSDSLECWLNNPSKGSWTDIVGIREYFSKRYQNVATLESGQIHGNHCIYIARHSLPIMNFAIIGNVVGGTSIETVYFGWLPGGTESNSNIFSTRDVKIVSLFKNHFEILIRNHTWNSQLEPAHEGNNWPKAFNIDYTKPYPDRMGRNKVVDKAGQWITIAYTVGSKTTVIDFAIVDITFKTGTSNVSVKLHNESGSFVEKIEEQGVAHYLDRLFFQYKRVDSNTTGLCFYEFQQSGELEIIKGFFAEGDDSRTSEIIGVRYIGKLEDLDDINFRKSEFKKLKKAFQNLRNSNSRLISG